MTLMAIIVKTIQLHKQARTYVYTHTHTIDTHTTYTHSLYVSPLSLNYVLIRSEG